MVALRSVGYNRERLRETGLVGALVSDPAAFTARAARPFGFSGLSRAIVYFFQISGGHLHPAGATQKIQ